MPHRLPPPLQDKKSRRLKRGFFDRPTLRVARELVGKAMVFHGQTGIITETEAYTGKGDEASHTARGRTKRNEVMFGAPGHAYVYFIYGMYYCLNFVTEPKGHGSAVLIRGLYLPEQKLHLNGPGKLCRHLNITREQNGVDIVRSPDFYLYDAGLSPRFRKTPRVGITKAADKLWRFVLY